MGGVLAEMIIDVAHFTVKPDVDRAGLLENGAQVRADRWGHAKIISGVSREVDLVACWAGHTRTAVAPLWDAMTRPS